MTYKEEKVFLEEIYNRHKMTMLRVICKQVTDEHSREDVFQEAFIRILKNIEKLADMSTERQEAYIVLLTRYAAIDYYRATHQEKYIDIDDDMLFMLLHRKKEQEEGMDDFSRTELYLILEQLSAEDRLLIIGKYYMGFSLEELANTLGCSPENARIKLFRAKKRLVTRWSESGVGLGDFFDA